MSCLAAIQLLAYVYFCLLHFAVYVFFFRAMHFFAVPISEFGAE